MPVTYLPTSTLSAALNDSDNAFNVASTTSISVGDIMVFKHEVMHVRDIPVSGRVVVRRGYEGTQAIAHRSGDTFYVGSPSEFENIRNVALGVFKEGATVPNICVPGAKGVDVNGYEYVLVDLTGSIYVGATVGISRDGLFTAAILAGTHSGPVGVLVETGTSDQWCWALRRGGYNTAKVTVGGSSLATSTGVCLAATSASTPSVGLITLTTSAAYSTSIDSCETALIYGMWPASATTTGTTATSAETGLRCKVWLENPYMLRKLTS